MFHDWTRAEILQLFGILSVFIATVTVAVIGAVLKHRVQEVHLMINNRMTQWLDGARAQGQLKEQDDAAARAKLNPPDV